MRIHAHMYQVEAGQAVKLGISNLTYLPAATAPTAAPT